MHEYSYINGTLLFKFANGHQLSLSQTTALNSRDCFDNLILNKKWEKIQIRPKMLEKISAAEKVNNVPMNLKLVFIGIYCGCPFYVISWRCDSDYHDIHMMHKIRRNAFSFCFASHPSYHNNTSMRAVYKSVSLLFKICGTKEFKGSI